MATTTHRERRVVPYTQAQMFDLVSDVERYPEFLPWCVASRIRKPDEHVFFADVMIGFKMVRETFTSRVELTRPGRIDVTYSEGPFKYLRNHWIFTPDPHGCVIDFDIAFEFKNRVFQALIGIVFNEAVRRMVASFEARAAALYGPNGQGVSEVKPVVADHRS